MDVPIQKSHRGGAKAGSVSLDRAIAELAAHQHGVASCRQLLALGLTARQIGAWADRGRLHRVHGGVYAVGHAAIGPRGRWLAAVLRGGPGAVLSHRSAGVLWGVVSQCAGPIEVTVRSGKAPPAGVRFHRLPLAVDERDSVDGIPVTGPGRTLCDLASVLGRPAVARALREAEIQRLGGLLSMSDVLARYPCRRGSATARAVLADQAEPFGVTRDDFEADVLALIEAAGLPRPRVNPVLRIGDGTVEPDFAWDDARVLVELDGREVHLTPQAFERDRARDRMLQARGWRTVRVTWRQARFDARAVVADLRRLVLGAS